MDEIQLLEGTIRAFESDLQNPQRAETEVCVRQAQILKLQQEIDQIRATQKKLPQLLEDAKKRLKHLKKKLVTDKQEDKLLKVKKQFEKLAKELPPDILEEILKTSLRKE